MKPAEEKEPSPEKNLLVKRENLGGRLILIDGLPGSGKLLIAELTRSIPNTSPWRYDTFFDYIPATCEIGRLEASAAKTLIKTRLDQLTYNSQIAREINLRPKDESFALQGPDSLKILVNLIRKPQSERAIRQKCMTSTIPVLTHCSSFGNSVVEESLDNRVTMIYALREPIECIRHYSGYVERIGADPRELTLHTEFNSQPIPWFIRGENIEAYINGNKEEKACTAVYSLYKSLELKLSANVNRRPLILDHKYAAANPREAALDICRQTGLNHCNEKMLKRVCKRNKVPRTTPYNTNRSYWTEYRSPTDNIILTGKYDQMRQETDFIYTNILRKYATALNASAS